MGMQAHFYVCQLVLPKSPSSYCCFISAISDADGKASLMTRLCAYYVVNRKLKRVLNGCAMGDWTCTRCDWTACMKGVDGWYECCRRWMDGRAGHNLGGDCMDAGQQQQGSEVVHGDTTWVKNSSWFTRGTQLSNRTAQVNGQHSPGGHSLSRSDGLSQWGVMMASSDMHHHVLYCMQDSQVKTPLG